MESGALRSLPETILQSSAASRVVARSQARKEKEMLSIPSQNLHLRSEKMWFLQFQLSSDFASGWYSMWKKKCVCVCVC